MVCLETTTHIKCSSGVSWDGSFNAKINYRIGIKYGVNPLTVLTTPVNLNKFVFNEDLLLDSFYHSENPSTEPNYKGSKWCSVWGN